MKRFFITLVVSFGIVLIILVFQQGRSILDFADVFNTEKTYGYYVSNALAYVGIPMFFISLIMMTDANRALISMGFAIRSIIPRYRQKYSDYYEFQEKKRRDGGVGIFGISSFIISIAYIVLALMLGEMYPHP